MAHPEIAALNEYRLSHDLTWEGLSEVLAVHNVTISPRTLYHLLKQMPANRTPRDRTLWKLRHFLKQVAPQSKRRRAKSAA